MNIWIVAAHDHVHGVDTEDRPLRYTVLTAELLKRGHTVVLWTSSFHHGRKQQRRFTNSSVQPELNYRVEFLPGRSYAKNVSFSRIRHNRDLAKEFSLRARKQPLPDIILCSIPVLELAEEASKFAALHHCPFVVDVVDIWPEVYLLSFPAFLRSVGRVALFTEFARLARIFARATTIISISQQYLAWASHLSRRKLPQRNLFYLGYPSLTPEKKSKVDKAAGPFLERFKIPKDKEIVAYVGTFGRTYDIETVVKAILTPMRTARFHFLLAGSGDKWPSAAAALKGVENVSLPGWLSSEETSAVLSSAAFGISSYASDAPQSLPYKPFEYMSYGLPQVCSLRGEFSRILEENGLGVHYEAGNAKSLCEALLAVSHRFKTDYSKEKIEDIFRRHFDTTTISIALSNRLEELAVRI